MKIFATVLLISTLFFNPLFAGEPILDVIKSIKIVKLIEKKCEATWCGEGTRMTRLACTTLDDQSAQARCWLIFDLIDELTISGLDKESMLSSGKVARIYPAQCRFKGVKSIEDFLLDPDQLNPTFYENVKVCVQKLKDQVRKKWDL